MLAKLGRLAVIGCLKERNTLKADTYILNLGARSSKGLLDYVNNAIHIVVLPRPSNKLEPWLQPSNGVLISDSKWTIAS